MFPNSFVIKPSAAPTLPPTPTPPAIPPAIPPAAQIRPIVPRQAVPTQPAPTKLVPVQTVSIKSPPQPPESDQVIFMKKEIERLRSKYEPPTEGHIKYGKKKMPEPGQRGIQSLVTDEEKKQKLVSRLERLKDKTLNKKIDTYQQIINESPDLADQTKQLKKKLRLVNETILYNKYIYGSNSTNDQPPPTNGSIDA